MYLMLICEIVMFVDRAAELAFLTNVLTRKHPGPGQLVMLYGRRRVGKTALLRHWAEQSGAPFTYCCNVLVFGHGSNRSLRAGYARTVGRRGYKPYSDNRVSPSPWYPAFLPGCCSGKDTRRVYR